MNNHGALSATLLSFQYPRQGVLLRLLQSIRIAENASSIRFLTFLSFSVFAEIESIPPFRNSRFFNTSRLNWFSDLRNSGAGVLKLLGIDENIFMSNTGSTLHELTFVSATN